MRNLITYLTLFCGLFCLGAQAANLKVSLAPTQAVTAGAQWRVDGGAWRASGTTVKGLSNGSHLVEFKAVAGWTNPAPRSVNLSGGGTTSLTATYVLAASVRITLSPATAQWRINGGGWLASGANATNLAAGSYQIDYSAQTGYSAPESETVTLAPGQALALNRNYVQQARVQFTLAPAEGQWRIDGGSWLASDTFVYMPAGNHLVEYAALPLYDAPAPETISLSAGAAFAATRAYVSQRPSLVVSLIPSSGQWRLDGGPWQASGDRLVELDVGDHTVEFSDIGDDHAPLAAETVTLALRDNLVLDRAYSLKPASLSITLTPASARWRVYPEGSPAPEHWNVSGASVSGLAPGGYSIDYESAEGFAALPAESLVLAPGQDASLSRAYTALARIQISLVPGDGQWRVDAGAWLGSDSSLFVPAGEHLVEYSALPLYDAPTPEAITLAQGEVFQVSRAYVSQRPSLQISLTPASAQWRLDGGAWQSSGATLTGLDVGEHTVEFSDIGGDHAPLATESVTLALRDNLVLNRAYSLKPASLSITLDPASARWRVYPDGTTPVDAWNLGGATVSGLAPGSYTVEYEAAAGYDTPPVEPLVLAPGQDISLTRDYALTGPAFQQLHSFVSAGTDARVLRGSDGLLYIATANGGANNAGQIVRMNEDGSDYTLLKAFPSMPEDGLGLTSLIEASDGMLYGTTFNGGLGTNNGTLFRINRDGSGYTILRSFVTPAQGSSPNSLLEGSDGFLYGTTGVTNIIFKIGKDGSGFTVLRSLTANLEGSQLRGLIEGADGVLYGINKAGGQNNAGTVFKIHRDGSGFAVLKTLSSTQGSAPNAPLRQASDGMLYATTTAGGPAGRGVVFRLSTNGSGFEVVHAFLGDSSDGGRSDAPVVEGPDGLLYGSTAAFGPDGRGTIFRMNKNGSGYQTVKSFTGTIADGGWPKSLMIAPSGTLFGANYTFGADSNGAVFRMNLDGSAFAKLFDLGSPNGSLPLAPVTEASDGALYGTTHGGGGNGYGTIYRIAKDGTDFAVVHRFTSTATGAYPQACRVTEGDDGLLYGVSGGGPLQQGMIFRLGKDGAGFTILRTFSVPTDGGYPNDIIEASDGFLYGTTQAGGALGAYSFGTVFRIAKDGTGYVVLRSFAGGTSDGATPYARLVEGADSMLYGTTTGGGSAGLGVVFKLAKDGSGYAVLHHFAGGANDGAAPYAPLFQGSDGRLYGTTALGGSAGYGTIFGINPDGSNYGLLKHFQGGADGASPYYTGLVEKDGVLWGTTNQGGAFAAGTVYRINLDGTVFETRVNFGLDIHDGRVPATGVSLGSDGYLYGTTALGSTGGTIFRLRAE